MKQSKFTFEAFNFIHTFFTGIYAYYDITGNSETPWSDAALILMVGAYLNSWREEFSTKNNHAGWRAFSGLAAGLNLASILSGSPFLRVATSALTSIGLLAAKNYATNDTPQKNTLKHFFDM